MLSLALTSAGTLYIITKVSVLVLALLLALYFAPSPPAKPEATPH